MSLGASHFMEFVTSFNYCWAVAACSVLHDGVFAGGMRVSPPASGSGAAKVGATC